jgi:imidazolonepropionase-like amidohydrolase
MGSAWVLRKSLYDALAYRRHGGGEKDPAMEVLAQVLEGEVPLRIQAREDIDIWSALRLGREFDLTFVLEEAIEAYRCIPELKEAKVPVIFGPIYIDPSGDRRSSGEPLRPCLNTAGLLLEAGIDFALTAGDLDGEDSLPRQAGFAMRFGLPPDRAMAAVTSAPARILGIDDRVGAIKPGLDADLVLWNGKALSPTARPILVMINGRVVHRGENPKNTGVK